MLGGSWRFDTFTLTNKEPQFELWSIRWLYIWHLGLWWFTSPTGRYCLEVATQKKLRCYLAKQKGEDMVLWGSGTPMRQFIFSEDLARLIVWVSRHTQWKPTEFIHDLFWPQYNEHKVRTDLQSKPLKKIWSVELEHHLICHVPRSCVTIRTACTQVDQRRYVTCRPSEKLKKSVFYMLLTVSVWIQLLSTFEHEVFNSKHSTTMVLV